MNELLKLIGDKPYVITTTYEGELYDIENRQRGEKIEVKEFWTGEIVESFYGEHRIFDSKYYVFGEVLGVRLV